MRKLTFKSGYKDLTDGTKVKQVLKIGLFKCTELTSHFLTLDLKSIEPDHTHLCEELMIAISKKKIDQLIKSLKKVRKHYDQSR